MYYEYSSTLHHPVDKKITSMKTPDDDDATTTTSSTTTSSSSSSSHHTCNNNNNNNNKRPVTYSTFTTLLHYMSRIHNFHLALLYTTALLGLVIASYGLMLEPNHADARRMNAPPRLLGMVVSFILFGTGVPQLLLLVTGFSVLSRYGFLLTLDVALWAATLALAVYTTLSLQDGSLRTDWIFAAAFLYAIRLNTYWMASRIWMRMAAARDGSSSSSSNSNNNETTAPLLFVSKLERVIQESNIATQHKNKLLKCVDDMFVDDSMDHTAFVHFLLQVSPLLLKWKARQSSVHVDDNDNDTSNSNAYKQLLERLDFATLIGEEQGNSNDNNDETSKSVIDTVRLVWRLLSTSQAGLAYLTLVVLVVSALTAPFFDMMVGNLVNIASSMLNGGQEELTSSFHRGIAGIFTLYMVDEISYMVA